MIATRVPKEFRENELELLDIEISTVAADKWSKTVSKLSDRRKRWKEEKG